MWTPKYVELRDPSGKLLQKTVQHTEDGPIELLYPIPKHSNSITPEEARLLVEENDWFNDPEGFVFIVEKFIKEKQCSLS